eukprot:TRINITY_DN3600_c0_g1_i1.p1 TRINITY_DN3600_c0_g1~~TRINITY_DN3600_c0_g1_i1.p1  ORF type:complete len:320 (+),score=140.60 TRINITY_DN3600_c0_g1_i1:70-960(+)
MSEIKRVRRIGIVGYGCLGKYLVHQVLEKPVVDGIEYQIAFIWNRTPSRISDDLPAHLHHLILEDLNAFEQKPADLIIEVSHPDIVAEFGEKFVSVSDFLVGSPTAFADDDLTARVKSKATNHALYVAVGALWAANDIKRLAQQGQLSSLIISMTKPAASLKVLAPLDNHLQSLIEGHKERGEKPDEFVVYDGPVKDLCPLAPNNVNTMATAALAASSALSFSQVQGRLLASNVSSEHKIVVEALGPVREDGERFQVRVERRNPATLGAVTGSATYGSFYVSLLQAQGQSSGLHFC